MLAAMSERRIPPRTLVALLLASAAAAGAARPRPQPPLPASADPLAAEIGRFKAYLASPGASGELWDQVKGGGEPVLRRAESALHDGRRLLALQRLAAVRETFSAARYLYGQPEAVRQDATGFEAEWRRVGELLRADPAPAAGALVDLRPAALRALGEAALPQPRVYHGASLDYARSTVIDSGLYYVGAALAQRDLPAFLRGLGWTDAGEPPPLRGLGPELDALEREILAAYRPPASIDRHPDFIRASAALKEARELDALGLRHGALLRYLQAVQRFAPVVTAGSAGAPDADVALEAGLGELDRRLAGPRDHTIGRLFLEAAQALAGTGEDRDPAGARGIVAHVLPRYFAALEPAGPVAPRPEPRATVTLVRWPYT
jgi:hypothetical protein